MRLENECAIHCNTFQRDLKKVKCFPFYDLRNEIKVMKVGKFYMMYWIQFSHLISGCSSQRVRFASFSDGSKLKMCFYGAYFASPHHCFLPFDSYSQ